MADLGSTFDLKSALGQATDGYFDGYSGLPFSSRMATIFMGHQTDHLSDFGNTVLFPASAYDSIVEPSIRFYKLRGYYVDGAMFETWVSKNPNSEPPSGHTLINISVVDTWTI